MVSVIIALYSGLIKDHSNLISCKIRSKSHMILNYALDVHHNLLEWLRTKNRKSHAWLKEFKNQKQPTKPKQLLRKGKLHKRDSRILKINNFEANVNEVQQRWKNYFFLAKVKSGDTIPYVDLKSCTYIFKPKMIGTH